MPKISILIAIYNGADSFNKSIDSLRKQTLKDIEIVCVNDNSTDNSLELLENYQKEDDRIKIVSFRENRGTICARKAGVEAATGEYIMFMDQDDQFEEYACEELYNMIVEKNVDIVNFRSKVIAIPPTTESQRKWQEDFMQPYDGFLYGRDVFDYCFKPDYESGNTWNKYTWNVWNKIYKTDVCKKAMLECAEDYVVNGDDMYVYMLISYYANSYYGDANGKFYHIYSLGSGLMGNHKLSLRRFYTLARRGKSVDNEIKFFADKDPDSFKEAVELDYARAICGMVQRWYSRLEDANRPEGFDMLAEYVDMVSIIAGLHKYVKVSYDKLIDAVKGAKALERTKVYIKTLAIYFSTDTPLKTIDELFIRNCRKAGYKVVCITDEGNDISHIVSKDEEVIYIPKELKEVNVCQYAIKARIEKINEIVAKNHIDAYIYTGTLESNFVYDMLIVKSNGTAFVIDDCMLQHEDSNLVAYKKALMYADGVILTDMDNVINDISSQLCWVSKANSLSIFEKIVETGSPEKRELTKLLDDEKLRKFYKKRAIKMAFKNGSFKEKIKIIIKLCLRVVGIKKNFYCDEYDEYGKLKAICNRL